MIILLEFSMPTTNGHVAAKAPSMNEASERDPFNNNCYGTLVDTPTSWSTCRCST